MTKTKFILIIVIIIVVIGGLGFLTSKKTPPTSNLDGFAQCLSDSGAKFYGTFWCVHCQNQKKLFGSAQKFLPYIECSTPDGQGQLEICKEAGIDGYPTWVFADETRLSGELPLLTLAEKTQCELPQ